MEKEANDKGKKKKEAVPVDANFDYEATFKSLAEEANRLMDDTESWSVVREVKTCVGMCKLMKKKCHEKGYPDYYVGAECVFEGVHDFASYSYSPGVSVDKFLDLFVVNMVTNCPKWDPTIVETTYGYSLPSTSSPTRKVQKFSDQDWIYQYIFDPGRVFFLINKRDMVYYEGWRKDEATGIVTNVGYAPHMTVALDSDF